MALISLIDQIMKSVSKGNIMAGVFLDFLKHLIQ